MILHRLCIHQPSLSKLQILAFRHVLYHQCVNDPDCIREDGMPRSSPPVQHRAAEVANFCLRLVGGRELYS